MTETDYERRVVLVMRKSDVTEWRSQMDKGNPTARQVLLAASKCALSFDKEFLTCSCCDRPFLQADKPSAYLVLTPNVQVDTEATSAVASPVCAECSAHDDNWVADNGVHRKGPFAKAATFHGADCVNIRVLRVGR